MAAGRRPTNEIEQASPAAPGKVAATAEARGAASAPPDGGPARNPLPATRMRLKPETVIIGERLRPLNPAKVEALIVSRAETGELPPIIGRLVGIDDDGVPSVKLVAGLHRLHACLTLGVPVDAMVREMTDAEALLVEIDENLLGPDLNPLDRAVFVEARLQAWALRFPDRVVVEDGQIQRKRGRPEKWVNFTQFPSMGFADETAVEIGLSKETVKKALQVARGLAPATRARLANSWIARNEGVLRQLAAVADPDEQGRVADQLLSGRTKNVSEAIAYAAGNTPIKPAGTPAEASVKALKDAWKAATPSGRDLMLHWLAGERLPKGWRVLKEAAGG